MSSFRFYFAWVGGPPEPEVTVITTGDTWGGELNLLATTWGGSLSTSANIIDSVVTDMLRDDGLQIGHAYTITSSVVPVTNDDGSPRTVTFIYDGDFTGTFDALATAAGTDLLLTSSSDRNVVKLYSTDGLEVGKTYAVSGNGIPTGTTATYEGSSDVVLSQNATSTSNNATLTFSSIDDKNLLKNIADISALTDGQTYELFGQGIQAGTTGVFDGTSTMVMSQDSDVTRAGGTVYISKGVTYDNGGDFDPDVHNVRDEDILSAELSQTEGEFATLNIEVQRPSSGLLNLSRKRWAWFSVSFDGGATIIPMFHGRVNGVPDYSSNKIIKIKLIARPDNYESLKALVAENLKVAPFWDDVFLAENATDPDTVLTARSALWDTPRVSLDLGIGDIIVGEDGTIVVDESQCLYEDFELSYNGSPMRRINVKADVTWTQTAEGDVDLTETLYNAFGAVGSANGMPVIKTFTGENLKSDWPKPLADLGGGWSMAEASTVISASWKKGGQYKVQYKATAPETHVTQEKVAVAGENGALSDQFSRPLTLPSKSFQLITPLATYDVIFNLSLLAFRFLTHYAAARQRTESISFSLEADVQAVGFEAGASEQEEIDLHSDYISGPIDPGGATPIGDLRRNSYFKTDRGQQSFIFLLMMARARLLMKSRIADVKFSVGGWELLVLITCRTNIELHDRRLPGGVAVGKVKGYTFKADGDSGEFLTSVVMGCTVGNGSTITPIAGDNDYSVDYDEDYEKVNGAQLEIAGLEGAITYQSFDDFTVYDDDGVDFFNMVPSNVVIDCYVTGGYSEQRAAIDQAVKDQHSGHADPVGALGQVPTKATLQLVPVVGGSFKVEYNVIVSKLAVPKTIDLGA